MGYVTWIKMEYNKVRLHRFVWAFGEMCHGMCFFLCFFVFFYIILWYQTPQNDMVYDHFGQNHCPFLQGRSHAETNRGFARNREELLGDAPWPGDALPSARCQKPHRSQVPYFTMRILTTSWLIMVWQGNGRFLSQTSVNIFSYRFVQN